MSVTRGTDSNVCDGATQSPVTGSLFQFFSQETSCEGFFLMAPVTGIILLCTLRSAWALLLLCSRNTEKNIPQTFLDTQDLFSFSINGLTWFFSFSSCFCRGKGGEGVCRGGAQSSWRNWTGESNFLTMNALPLGLDVLLSAPHLVALHPRTLGSLGLHFPESSFHGVSG